MKKKLLIACISISGLIIGGSLIALLNRYNSVVVSSEPRRVLFDRSTPTPTPDPLAPYGILLMGYGGGTHDGGYLTDTMIVAYVEPKNAQITLISLPRDMWVPLPLESTDAIPKKINAAYAFGRDQNQYESRPERYKGDAGGGELAKQGAHTVTGLPIRYFAVLSFAGFEKSIDTLGGVEITVPHTFSDDYYPIEKEKDNTCDKSDDEIDSLTATLSGELLEQEFSCRYETLEFEKGVEHMDGERALKFVRSRKSDSYGGDYYRSERQLALIQGVKKKVLSVNFIPKIIPFISSLTRDMQTDIGADDFKSILDHLPDLDAIEIKTIRLTTDNILQESRSDDGQYILIPQQDDRGWESVHEFIHQELIHESA